MPWQGNLPGHFLRVARVLTADSPNPTKRAPPPGRDAGVRQTLLRPVVQWRAAPDTDGQVATNDGGSPTGRPPCPATPPPINPAPIREWRSSLVIRN